MQRLSGQTLATLPKDVRRPHYDRTQLAIGMAHVGVGAFHRCHQAEFTDDMLEKQRGPWGTVGINLRPPNLTEMLGRQDGLYSRTLRQGAQAETRVIGSIREVIDAGDVAGAQAAIAALADPAIKIVTMTITEKAYYRVPATGALDRAHPDVRHDAAGTGPLTVLGLLARAFDRRREAGAGGLTVISCDNVPANGELLRSVLGAFLETAAPGLLAWVERHVAFPSTMVDRIVPATSDADRAFAAEQLGVADEAAVVGEKFRQWVIEDHFAGERPPWDLAGAQFVSDVAPFELTKMRVLNAAQSTLSHCGAILGHEFSFQAAADPVLAPLVRRMLESETLPTLPPTPGMEAGPYIAASMERIANPAIRHRCRQIGTDGSQKIVQRLVNPLRERLRQGHAPGLLGFGLAAWMAYALCGAKIFGARWALDDPWAARVIALAGDASPDFPRLARALLKLDAIFGTDLVQSPALVAAIAGHLEGLLSPDPGLHLRRLLGEA